MSEKLKPCPFCGARPKELNYYTNQGTKWGYASCPDCDASSPEVRTGYDISENAEWHKDALKEWNKRTDNKYKKMWERLKYELGRNIEYSARCYYQKMEEIEKEFEE